ncbi:MAG: HAMP domain-containing histidine kinase [Clostridiales bacterium]|nr:HAMP domain-containing histidine kinase [Clostridiales bacterium]
MKKIRYRLLARSMLVFVLLTAVLVSVLVTLAFERSLESERVYTAEKLEMCIKGIQSVYAGYAVQGEKPNLTIIQNAAAQIEASAKVEMAYGENSVCMNLSDKTIRASAAAQMGNEIYRVSIERDLTDLYEFRENFLDMYRMLYLVFLPVGMFLMYSAGKGITGPVEAMKSASDALSSGDYSRRIAVSTGDEIEALAGSFNRMAQTVQGEIERREILIGNLAHEMKTPLQAILGHADLIRMDRLPEEERLIAAETIRHEAMRLNRLSARMMEWMSMDVSESVNLVRVNTGHILQNVHRAFETQIQIDMKCDDTFVIADGVLLETLLANLMDNSVNAGAKHILMRAEAKEGNVIFSICDDGCGMEEETLMHLEEPFYREDKARTRSHGGAGLGLALAARIACIHNTQLKYESEKGKGTCVEFALKEAEND